MSQLLDFYEYNKGNANISAIATEYLLKDTLGKNLQGENKIKDIDGMNMENNLNGHIIPGMIFTFQYKVSGNLHDDVERLNLGDKFPIILCCSVKLFEKNIKGKLKRSICIQGINLNMLEREKRLKLLNNLHDGYLSFYENEIYKKTYENSIAINNDLGFKLQDFNFIKAISGANNIDLNNCFRTYDISHCLNIRLIEYNLWKYIPFYNPKRYILNLTEQQKEQIALMLNQ